MKKTTLLGAILAAAVSSAPVIAGDFHALKLLQGTSPSALQDSELAATEGGATCSIGTASGQGGFAVCANFGNFQSVTAVTEVPMDFVVFFYAVQ